MLSQGRVKPNSASRHHPGQPSGGGGTTAPPQYMAPQKLLIEVTAANIVRNMEVSHSPSLDLSGGNPTALSNISHRGSRSGSSLAVAHQEFTAATINEQVNRGFPNRGAAVSANFPLSTATQQASSANPVANTAATGGTARKGVAPMNARPVPVVTSTVQPSAASPHVPPQDSQGGGYSSPVLSNTARQQQHLHQQLLMQQQQQLRDQQPSQEGKEANRGTGSTTSSGKLPSDQSSANSSENSPTTAPALHPSQQPFPKAPPLDLNSKSSSGALGGSPRHPSVPPGRSGSSNRLVALEAGGPLGDDERGSPSLTHTASSGSISPLTEQQGATGGSNGGTPPPVRGSVPTPTSKRTTNPTPPPSNQKDSTAKKASGGGSTKTPQIDIGPACQALSLYDAFSFDVQLKMWVVRDDVLAKCLEYIRIMGYQHPAYTQAMNDKKSTASKKPSMWCPGATITSPIVAAAPPRVNLSSPTVPAASKLDDKSTPPSNSGPQWRLVPLAQSPASNESQRANDTAAELSEGRKKSLAGGGEADEEAGGGSPTNVPPTVPSPSVATTSETEPVCPLFFECEESLRWLAEQEYVIGTILLCCSFEPLSTSEKRAKIKKHQQGEEASASTAHNNSPTKSGGGGTLSPNKAQRRQYVPAHTHPVRYVAAHVIHNFSHWGDFKSFSSVWDAQVRIVLGVAASSHQKVIPVPETGLVFSSEFECGNLARVQRHVQGAYNNPFAQSGICQPGTTTNVYLLWIEGDTQSDKRLWFRFAVSGCKEREPLCIRMMNIAPNARLYRNGMKPVWRAGASQLQWTAVDDYSFHLINDDRDGELSFFIMPKSSIETIHVAFCVPYSYGDLLCHITQWHALVKRSACNIRFEERVLCRTLDERKLHLLIITSQTEKVGGKQQAQQLDSRGRPIQQAGATPYSSFSSGKKVVLISGRVHPGEVTASHAVHGIVSFLLSHDPRAATLREHFIFFVVPMLNPDGVARGHSRLDQNGLNLNRCYNDPNPATQPTVHSLRNVFDHLQTNFRDRFFMYLDFHSHASQQAGFAFGNHLPNSVQHWNMLFPKLTAIHSSELFDFDTCRFSRGHMVSKDGTSRVLFGGSLIHSYTIELTHFTDFKCFGDRHADPNSTMGKADAPSSTTTPSPALPPPATVAPPTSAKTKSDKKNSATDGTAEEKGGTKATPATSASPPPAAVAPALQSPVINGVLCQSAEVGRACVLALLDYCSIGECSLELQRFGGMDRAIREVKREIRGGGPQRPSSYSSQSSFKQY